MSIALVLSNLLLISCEKNTTVTKAQIQAQEYSIPQLLNEETLRQHVSLGSLEVLSRTVEKGQIGVRYEWPLNSPEFIQEANKERARLSLLNGKAPALIPSSARISLKKRGCEMNLVQLRDRLCQDASLTAQELPRPLRVGSSSGLWCPVGRVLHFDTPSGRLSLGVEMGRGESRDYELAVELASTILKRSEEGFFAPSQRIANPSEESWITVE